MFRNNTSVSLLTPHKPEQESEKKRIEAAGGAVVWYNMRG